ARVHQANKGEVGTVSRSLYQSRERQDYLNEVQGDGVREGAALVRQIQEQRHGFSNRTLADVHSLAVFERDFLPEGHTWNEERHGCECIQRNYRRHKIPMASHAEMMRPNPSVLQAARLIRL